MRFENLTMLVALGFTLLLVFTMTPNAKNFKATPATKEIKDYSHNPIWINSDSDMINMAQSNNWNGSGTASDPYIIEGYYINAENYGYGIIISNVSLYFVIRNNTIVDSILNGQFNVNYTIGEGILINNTKNGVIENNTIEFNENQGIFIRNSQNIKVCNNDIESNSWGILAADSNDINIENNKIIKNQGSGVFLIRNYNTKIYDNIIYKNSDGLELINSNYNDVHNNSMDGTDTGYMGMFIDSSSQNQIKNNTIRDFVYGLYLNNTSASNYILGNIILRNSMYGVYAGANTSGNVIYDNEFYYNHNSTDTYIISRIQALDNGTGNHWYSETEKRGNYWRDWANNNYSNDRNNDGIVDWPYAIAGSANTVDKYPLKDSSYNIPELNPANIIIILIVFSIVASRFIKSRA